MRQEGSGIAAGQILFVDVSDLFQLEFDFAAQRLREGQGSILLALTIVHCQDHHLQIDVLYAQLQAFEQP